MSVGSLPTPPAYPLSVKQYHRMIEAGILTENDPVELLEGYLVAKMPKGPAHDATITVLADLLADNLGESGWLIRIQSAITLKKSEPEPDLAVVTGPPDKYFSHHPGPDEIGLVIEVAESSLDVDRKIKGRLYARANIQQYWIVNLVDVVLEVYGDPKAGRNAGYQATKIVLPDDKVSLQLHGQSFGRLPVTTFLPSR